jgi:hypothetical protein
MFLVVKKKKYIPLSIFNSDYVVMSHGNRNFHLRIFIKGGALQLTPLAVDGGDGHHPRIGGSGIELRVFIKL